MTLVLKPGLNLQSPTANDPLLDLNTQPSLDLQFATSKTLDDAVSGTNLITFSRASSGTYVDSDGLIKTAVTDAPRFDHDPVTGESLGLLIEESRTNLLRYSEQFDQSVWAVGGTVSVVPNSALGPNGLMTADQITLGSTGARIGQFNLITTPGQTGTASVYLKNIDHVGQLTLRTGLAGGASYNLNLSLTSEWVRYELTTTHNGTQDVEFHIRETSANPSGSFLVFGAQLEEGSFPTSYIPTSGSAITRAADVASIEGTNFSSFYNQSEGTVFVDRTFNINNGQTYYFTDSTLTANRIRLEGINHSGNNSSDGSSFNTAAAGNKTALGLQTDNVSVNGGTPDTSFTMPSSLDRLFIGRHPTVSSSYLNGHIARLAYFPTRKTDQQLIDLTT